MTRMQRFIRTIGFISAIALSLIVVDAAMAEEAGGEKVVETSYFSQFFGSDSTIGTIVIWMLIVNSTALMAIIVQGMLQNRRTEFLPPVLEEQLENLIQTKQYREAVTVASASPSMLGRVIDHSLQQARRGYDAMEQAAFEMAEQIGNDKVRGLVWMEVAGAAGPMMGLFGTVYGMIVAFSEMVALGGNPKPAELAGGIATALVCTFWGLVVGIPGVISAAFFRVKIEGNTAAVIFAATELIAPFRGGVPAAIPPATTEATPKPAAKGSLVTA